MKKVLITLSLAVLISLGVSAQQTMQLTFTAIDSTYYTQLDSIKIINRAKDCDTVLYWNDTVLVLDVNVGLPEQEINEQFNVQAYPNPVMEEAILNVVIPEAGKTDVTITNIQGRQIFAESYDLTAGKHAFRFIPGGDAMYFISFSWQDQTRHLKLINASPQKGRESILSYVGGSDQIVQKKSSARSDFFEFTLGDQLLYIGYIDTLESGIPDVPLESEVYTFQFAYNIPCIGTPTVEYEGQVYNTVQIFSQCWLKENLNVGTMIDSLQDMQDNGIIERYCYRNSLDSCEKYGGLYQWGEMMQYITQEGVRGICPEGWHIPSDYEWCTLTKCIDPTVDCDLIGYSGTDAGFKMKSTSGWYAYGNGSDTYGISVLSGGIRDYIGNFSLVEEYASYWSSTTIYNTHAYTRHLQYNSDEVNRNLYDHGLGFSVRCVKD
ncbi:MAG: FISUMP domain-containing protein [Bacteroidota bacterium]|nr:FISUMP domain-containing protein [Bacteroidota bacterium]